MKMNALHLISLIVFGLGLFFLALAENLRTDRWFWQMPKPRCSVVAKRVFVDPPKYAMIYLSSHWESDNTLTRNYWFVTVDNALEIPGGKKEKINIVTGQFDSVDHWRTVNDLAWAERESRK